MAKASKASLDAKGYINGKVNEMKEKFKKTQDESARKELIETFRETTSSDEYQKQLKIVNENAKSLRKWLNPWDRTPENFEKAKEDFYWKLNTYLSSEEIREFLEKDMYEQIDFLFKKFWDWDKTLSIILNLADRGEMPYESNVNRDGKRTHYWDTKYEERMYRMWVHNKFHNLSVKVAKELLWLMPFEGLILHNPEAFSDEVRKDPEVIKFLQRNLFDKKVFGWDHTRKNRNVILKKIWDENIREILKVASPWNIERLLRPCIDNWSAPGNYINIAIEEITNNVNVEKVNHYNPNNYKKYEQDFSKFIKSRLFNIEPFRQFHKKFADSLINAWYIDVVKENINLFAWLSDEEKSEISWRDLIREKFDSDLIKLQELWEKLWLTIKVEEKKEEKEERKSWKWLRKLFWKK